jgi:hypothetical protein
MLKSTSIQPCRGRQAAERSHGMFCSNCGAEASGNFCAACGFPLKGRPPAPASIPRDWSDEVSYETLIRIPEVRDLIVQAASASQRHMSAEDFLNAADKLISVVVPMVSLKTIADLTVPVFDRIGINTGKVRSETVQIPPAKAIVATLCAFAAAGQEIRRVQQFDDGCLLEAAIPSDIWSWEGSLFVTIRRSGTGSRIDAATRIKGQLFDWGKSKRCLDRLFSAFKETR